MASFLVVETTSLRVPKGPGEAVTERERGFVRQACIHCGHRCDSSTIFREYAETYDPRCPKCGDSGSMRMVEWVPARDESLSAAKTRVEVVAHDGLFSLVDECGGLGATFVTLEEAEMAAENLSPIRRDAPGKE